MSRKEPSFKFYPDSFISGCMFMSHTQIGKYISLLCGQASQGHLEERVLLEILDKEKDKEVLKKFTKDSKGLYYNKRLEIEVQAATQFGLSRANNRRDKANPAQTELGLKVDPITYNHSNLRKYFQDNQSYNESTCMKFKISLTELKVYQEDFLGDNELKQEVYPSMQKGLAHWINWLAGQIRYKQKDKDYKKSKGASGAKVIEQNKEFGSL